MIFFLSFIKVGKNKIYVCIYIYGAGVNIISEWCKECKEECIGERDAVSITTRRDKKKKRKNHWETFSGGGSANLPFMRGGYGSRGVCRLIRVFLVRFSFFQGTLSACTGEWLGNGQVNIRYAPCSIPRGRRRAPLSAPD